jgi:hypothetical protein
MRFLVREVQRADTRVVHPMQFHTPKVAILKGKPGADC